MIPSVSGTYMLLLKLAAPCTLKIGKTGENTFEPGYYCYVGSALGPGGLKARLGRHATIPLKKHWHIDYLRPHVEVVGALIKESPRKTECRFSKWAAKRATACMKGFGASDCRCHGHLFYFGRSFKKSVFKDQAVADLHVSWLTPTALRTA